jgi:hypothetical protein
MTDLLLDKKSLSERSAPYGEAFCKNRSYKEESQWQTGIHWFFYDTGRASGTLKTVLQVGQTLAYRIWVSKKPERLGGSYETRAIPLTSPILRF